MVQTIFTDFACGDRKIYPHDQARALEMMVTFSIQNVRGKASVGRSSDI
jgi:hypothetical protein